MKRCSAVFGAMTLFFIILSVTPSPAAQKDACREEGIIVKNLTTRDLWRKTDGGACFVWRKDHTFTIKPGDKIGIFSDLTCETYYCKDNPTYKAYKVADKDGSCGVRILPRCKLSDM